MKKRILVPVDGSAASEKAVQTAEQLLSSLGGDLTLFTVVESIEAVPGILMGEHAHNTLAAKIDEATDLLNKVAGQCTFEVTCDVAVGRAADQILFKSRQGYDLLVMGSSGLGHPSVNFWWAA